ncbi:hypothetical protein BV121_1538 [Haemophilus influenzae]|nr:hypothetical protein BV121_1538 [Haemophilus influenzae]AVJ02158.1 hypothetical protein BV122_1727 [Haemophilus influenzae]
MSVNKSAALNANNKFFIQPWASIGIYFKGINKCGNMPIEFW